MTSPSSSSSTSARAPARSSRSRPSCEPLMTADLASASAARALSATTVACTTSVTAGRPVRGSMRWWRRRRRAASGGRRCRTSRRPGGAGAGRRAGPGRRGPSSVARVGRRWPPATGRPASSAHGDVAVGIDEGRRVGRQERQRAVGDPALADPVQVEEDAAFAVHDAARPCERSPSGAGPAGGSLASLRGQAGLEQADVHDALGALRDRCDRRSTARAWAARVSRRLGMAVERAEVGVRAEAGQTARPGPDPAAARRRSRSARRPASGRQATRRRTRPPMAANTRPRSTGGLGAGAAEVPGSWPRGRLRRVVPGDHPPDCLVRVTGARVGRRGRRRRSPSGPRPAARAPPRG